MLIKNSTIDFQWQKKFPAVFMLLGSDSFQCHQVAKGIISSAQNDAGDNIDKKVICISKAADWSQVAAETSTFSLFAESVLLDIRYEPKTFDAEGKKFLESYLKNINPRCLLLIRAPHVSLKQLELFTKLPNIDLIFSSLPSAMFIKQWILKRLNLKIEGQHIAELIYQFTEGNLEATAQVLEKLALMRTADEALTIDLVRSQLSDQTAYSLYELADACLNANTLRALQILQKASSDKTEATLILWILTQEVRNLLQLLDGFQKAPKDIMNAAAKLKIWSSRVPLYQKALTRITAKQLNTLLSYCSNLDRLIKTSQSKQIWQSFELIILSLCQSKERIYAY